MMSSIYKQQYHLMPRDETCLGLREVSKGMKVLNGQRQKVDSIKTTVIPIDGGGEVVDVLFLYKTESIGFVGGNDTSGNRLRWYDYVARLSPYDETEQFVYPYVNRVMSRVHAIASMINSRIQLAFSKKEDSNGNSP